MLRIQADRTANVRVIDPSRGVAEIRKVTIGHGRAEGWIAISEGLKAGDRLISGDTSMLHPGHRVKVVGEADVPMGSGEAIGEGSKGGSGGTH